MPKISVVLPVYNGEKYLRDSIESVFSQSMTDWELIVVDDASTDSTPDIIKEYCKKDDRIKSVRNIENMQLPRSLNNGFALAGGQYYTWTSDDNIMLKYALEELSGYLDTHNNCAMVCSAMILMDEEKRVIDLHPEYNEPGMILFDTVGASFMYRRDIAEKVGDYDTSLFCVEDYDYWIRILENGGNIDYIKGCHYLYRVHKKTLTVEKESEVRRMQRKLYNKHLTWIMDGLDDEEDIAYLYNELCRGGYFDGCERIKDKFAYYSGDTELCNGKEAILFGAGNVGRRVYDRMKDRVSYWADTNLYGRTIDGIRIISFDDMISKMNIDREKYQIVVCVGYEKQFQMIQQLKEKGVDHYTIYSRLFQGNL